MKTQKQRVIDQLKAEGVVTNFWAFNNYILRLGAVILELKKDGWIFNTAWGTKLGEKKNFHYYVVSRPKGQQALL